MKVTPKPPRRRDRRRDLACLLSLAMAAGALLLLAAPAAADMVLCGPGSAAGQCESPAAVAVDRKEGLLYVADTGNRRVDVFEVDGTFLRAFGWDVSPGGAPGDAGSDQLEVCTSACQPGSAGSGSGQFQGLTAIAVDNGEASPAFGDIYVLDDAANRVQRFHPTGEFVLMFGKGVNQTTGGDVCPRPGFPGDLCKAGSTGAGAGQIDASPEIDLGSGGIVHVADNVGGGNRRVQRFSSEGELISSCSPLSGDFGVGLSGFAVDSTGSLYLAGDSGTPVRKYDSSCALVKEFHPSFNIQTLAVDAADNLLVTDTHNPSLGHEIGGDTAVYQYNSAATLLQVFYGNGTLQTRPLSLAPYTSATGDVFAAEDPSTSHSLRRVVHVAFPPPGPVVHPDPALTKAEPIGNTKATLNTRINPEGKFTTAHFQYVDHETYLEEGFATPTKTATATVGNDFALHQVSAEIGCADPATEAGSGKCLVPEATYHFRAVASNSKGTSTGPEATFETKPPFEILATFAIEVGAGEAKLHAEVNPLAIAASGHFEYVDEVTFLESGFAEATQTPELDFGSGEEPVIRGAQLHSLQPETTYRYRVVVTDLFATKAGPELSFITFPLPEPPPDPDPCHNQALRSGASASLPDCRAYEMVTPIDKEGGGFGLAQSAAQVPAAGRGFTYISDRAFGEASSAPLSVQYMASRSPDLDGSWDEGEGWRSESISAPREGGGFGGLGELNAEYKAFSEDLGQAWVGTFADPPLTEEAIAGYPNLYRRESTSGTYGAICPAKPPIREASEFSLELQAFSAEPEITVFAAPDRLTPQASSGKDLFGSTFYQLYGCEGDQLRLLSVLPGGEANEGYSSAGTHLSALGDYTENSVHNVLSADGSRLYWTDLGMTTFNSGGGRIYLRERPFAAGGECTGAAAPCTVEVSEAVGVPGADQKAHFWTASPDGSMAIFSFTEGALEGNLYEFDAESGTPSLIAEGVSGVAGFSEDARRLYLLSSEALAPGAIAGKPNLYLYEAGEGFRLVAAFPDGVGLGGYCEMAEPIPTRRCSRATPDGSRLAFMSGASLSGYDNADAESGEPDAEVYLYDATANGGEGELHCVSCNPSGARPAGRPLRVLGTTVPAWVAAQIPGLATAFHPTRVLSADGHRLFFESTDALLPADTNGAQDLYQWQRAGKGGCDAADANHFPQNGGCLDLISSGTSPQDSEFIDASADGSDVFFATTASLVPQDPERVDIYDARIGGGFPPPPPPEPPCEGEACQSPPAPPQAIHPSSSSFRGPGNPSARGKGRARCPKGKRRALRRGKPRCVKRRGARQHKGAQRRPRRATR